MTTERSTAEIVTALRNLLTVVPNDRQWLLRAADRLEAQAARITELDGALRKIVAHAAEMEKIMPDHSIYADLAQKAINR